MKDYILLKNLHKEVEAGNISLTKEGDLSLFKYTQDCHIENRWNEINIQARGIIFRDDGTIIARPFPKFFNLGETSKTSLENLPWNESVEIFEKLDGSCGIGYLVDDEWRIATPGSFNSDQALYASDLLEHVYNQTEHSTKYLPKDCTPVFEIIYPENRIVCDYKNDCRGSTFLALLAIVEHSGKEWHQSRVDQLASYAGFPRPKRYSLNLRSEIPFNDNEEGYVALFESGLRVKVKSPAYLRIHRLLNYLSPRGVIDLIRGREYGSTLQLLPPTIARDFDDIRAAVQNKFDEIFLYANNKLQELLKTVGKDSSRKEKAIWIQANVRQEIMCVLFGMLDERDIKDYIWKIIYESLAEHRTIISRNDE